MKTMTYEEFENALDINAIIEQMDPDSPAFLPDTLLNTIYYTMGSSFRNDIDPIFYGDPQYDFDIEEYSDEENAQCYKDVIDNYLDEIVYRLRYMGIIED